MKIVVDFHWTPAGIDTLDHHSRCIGISTGTLQCILNFSKYTVHVVQYWTVLTQAVPVATICQTYTHVVDKPITEIL